MAAQGVVHAATTGFDNASAYDAHRPSYPPQALQSLLSHLRVADKPNAKIIDLAAGTGKFTELLVAREEHFEIVAVEPVAKMRESLAGKKLKRVDVRDGLATGMNISDGWADAVIAAQSFHWFAHEAALEEIHRVLKPSGTFGIIWNIEDYNQPLKWTPSTEWEGRLKQLVQTLAPDGSDRFRDDKWWQVFDRQSRAAEPFFAMPIGQETVHFTAWRTREMLWDRMHTLSQVAVLSAKDKEMFQAKLDEILTHGDQVWNEKREVEFHGITIYAWMTRT